MESEPFYIEDCPKIPINDKGWSLQGFSRAGDRTGFLLYPMKFLFDCGVRTNSTCENVFMTHVHTDHSLELPAICSRHKIKETSSHYHVHAPSTSIRHLTLLFRCVSQLSFPDSESHSDEQILKRSLVQFRGVDAGESFLVSNNSNRHDQYEVTVLPAHHSVQAVGYGISSRKKKLKEQYVKMMSDETIDKRQRVAQLEALKRNPEIDLYETVITPELVFFCDSNIFNLSQHEEWKAFPVIVCECTGLSLNRNLTEEEWISRGHTSISQLLRIMRENKEKKWILIHAPKSLNKEEMLTMQRQLQEEEGLDIVISC